MSASPPVTQILGLDLAAFFWPSEDGPPLAWT
eukprot:CAMPEP_0194034416 /NCGR_PEP_ID=MMETSP0009_2-20130614/6830_1 /TAXON_ID=210454 /ORGANISM="Grammatophora oceanica, Strain CCMP 410" /LENGTH=31 /DNA_ID= /DNA_START= /DNA_END= /DNA_ORIENTATION=